MSFAEILPSSSFQLNIEGLVAASMAVERRPLTTLQSAQQSLGLRSATLSDLKSSLSALRSKAQALIQAGTLSPFQAKTVVSSNTAVATMTASTSAVAGVHTLSVTQLARLSTVVSNQLTSTATTAEGDGTKTIKVTYDGTDPTTSGTAVSVNMTVTAGDSNNTVLTNLAAAINNDTTLSAKVSASVVSDTSSTVRLVLTSKTTGLANKVRVADSSGTLLSTIGLNSETASSGTTGGSVYADSALDAKFKLDGLDITRGGNTVSDVLSGVTINLLATSTSDVTLTVASDKASIKSTVQGLLDAYNSSLKFLRERTSVKVVAGASNGGKTEVASVIRGTLADEGIYFSLISSLRVDVGGLVSSAQSGNPTMLSEIGITAASDGTLSISDTAKFDSAIESKLTGLTDLFASTNGVAVRLISRMDGFVNTGGLIDGGLSTVTSKISGINQQITTMQDRLVKKEASLRKQLSQLQEALSMLSAQRFLLQ
jgi:flagellar hook-associated protein 2